MPASGNVGAAFALVLGAGASTALGAATVFYKKTSPTMLAIGLGLAAGVMLYVSMVEIFMIKGVGALTDGGWGEDGGYRGGTILLFVGMIMTWLLNMVANHLADYAFAMAKDDAEEDSETKTTNNSGSSVIKEKATQREAASEVQTKSAHTQVSMRHSKMVQSTSAATGNLGPFGPNAQLWMLDSFRRPSLPRLGSRRNEPAMDDIEVLMQKKAAREERMEDQRGVPRTSAAAKNIETPEDTAADGEARVNEILTDGKQLQHLQKMGVMTALSIAIHNVPEGLATFVAALNDPLNAVPIALAISLHNIPEGICVAVPIFYATGDRWKGFWWAVASGASELIGGLLGYLVLYGNRMSDVAYGVLFCLVAGMMVYIVLMELIPTALKFDPDNRILSRSVLVGMAAMAISLLFFTTSGLS